MGKRTYPLYHGDKRMPWPKGTVVKDFKGLVFLSGTEGRDEKTDEVVAGIEAQTRLCVEKIKSRLEEMGSSLENIVKITYYVVGPFDGDIANSPLWVKARTVRDQFFKEHCPDLCSDKNPVASTLIGVERLDKKEMLIEVDVIAVLLDR
ncbi:MAG: RidA family protein [Desulfobacterales bacterium]|nr:RidA family protein [Desulfobacterales bacterium]